MKNSNLKNKLSGLTTTKSFEIIELNDSLRKIIGGAVPANNGSGCNGSGCNPKVEIEIRK
ncbi:MULTISPECIES: hypothetical protein [unclassified Flavobacterium]|jgi:hypothetical protein|uniref:hypothetical protein n=1 Tax=unclassified Flavobacterium TaxID=196869 RepID=UPI000580AC33|nr:MULTISPECIES: hypothetical protein [unclassified Flavobacterium]KIA97513.1 hypothetical protein OA93_13360 [Flavobacterium sp. KMS]KIC00709.1 hypothetical protein OA88_18020 [Flavobacterium sp. JRM]MEA9415082.1 hypothetical protein [Flavobacterium sp. PL02]